VERRSVADNAARLQRRAAGNTALGRRHFARSTRRGTGTAVVTALPALRHRRARSSLTDARPAARRSAASGSTGSSSALVHEVVKSSSADARPEARRSATGASTGSLSALAHAVVLGKRADPPSVRRRASRRRPRAQPSAADVRSAARQRQRAVRRLRPRTRLSAADSRPAARRLRCRGRNRPSTSPSPTGRRRWPHGCCRGAAPVATAEEPADGCHGHLGGVATCRRDHRHRGAAVCRRQCGSAPAPCRWQYCARAQVLNEIDAPRDWDDGRHCIAGAERRWGHRSAHTAAAADRRAAVSGRRSAPRRRSGRAVGTAAGSPERAQRQRQIEAPRDWR